MGLFSSLFGPKWTITVTSKFSGAYSYRLQGDNPYFLASYFLDGFVTYGKPLDDWMITIVSSKSHRFFALCAEHIEPAELPHEFRFSKLFIREIKRDGSTDARAHTLYLLTPVGHPISW